MKPAFNLLDEEWIPCVMASGEPRELSLRDTLVEAGQVREVFDSSPLITASLHRLLLALLWRCFPLRSLADWKALWQQQRFDAERLEAYFKQWHERFYLLHPEKPFYQRSDFSADKKTSLKKLVNEFSSGSNGTLFDHSWDEDRPLIESANAARWTIATQYFGLGGGQSVTGINFSDCLWTRGAIILLEGDTLFETLCFNLLNLLKPDFPADEDDRPVWELEHDWQPAKNQIPKGLSEYLTWQGRSVRLTPDADGVLRECFYAQGKVLAEGFKNEPMYAYKRSDQHGLITWQFDEAKVMWRDSHSLFDLSTNASFQLPAAFNFIARLSRDGALPTHRSYSLHILGQCTKPGKAIVRFWRSERLPLNSDYLIEKRLLDKLRDSINLAERVAGILQASLNLLARNLIKFIADRNPDKKDVEQLTQHLQSDAHYWSRLEIHFKNLLVDLPNDRILDEEGEVAYGHLAMNKWANTLHDVAEEVFKNVIRSLDGSSRALKAVAIAQSSFSQKLRAVLGDYLKSETAAETAPTGG